MRMDRIRKVMENMRKKGLDQLLITSETSLFYLTEHWVHPMERFLALYLNSAGEWAYIANDLFFLNEKISCPVLRYHDSEDPIEILKKVVKNSGRMGVDFSMAAGFLLKIQEAFPNAAIEEASSCVLEVRMIKDAEEVALLRESSAINDKAIGELFQAIHPGCTEEEISRKAPEIYCRYGAKGYHSCPLVSFGANAADPHHGPNETVLKTGDCILIDTGSIYRDYCSDMTRTVFFQKVSPEMKKVYEVVKDAQESACSVIRPGVPASEIDRAARKIIEDQGYGRFFNHRLGHNLGLDGHETPGISADNPAPVREGMVFSVEPGVYLPGVGGVRIEDLVVVTQDGCERLNTYEKELQILG